MMRFTTVLSLLVVAACGGGGGGSSNTTPPSSPPAATYTVGGSVSGLAGSGLTLALNGAHNLSISAPESSFTFQPGLTSGSQYTVTVATQPSNPAQLCTVSAGSGTMVSSNTTTVSVSCFYAGRFVYVAQVAGISAYAINHSTGALNALPGSPYGPTEASELALRPDGKFLYGSATVGPTTGAIWVYAIDNATGVLTEIPGSPFATSTQLAQIATDPTGKFLFTTDFTTPGVSAFTLDPDTGVPKPVTGSPFPDTGTPISIAVDPSGKFVFVGHQTGGQYGLISAYTIDPTSGALTPVAGSPFPTVPQLGQVLALAVSPNGKFVFAGGVPGVAAYTLDASSGALTLVSGSPFSAGAYPATFAVDPQGKYLYVGNNSESPNSQIFGLSIDQTTGALTSIAGDPYASSALPECVTIDPSGDFLYVENSESDALTVYAVNKATGSLTVASTLSIAVGNSSEAIAILK